MLTLCLAALAAAPTSQDEETWLRCGEALVVPGEAPRREVTLVVRAGRIAAVHEGYPALAPGVRSIDLKERFVLPGLIDCHTHITMQYSRDVRLERVERSDADQAIRAVVYAGRTLDAGFTTIRNVGSSGDAVFALRDAIEEGLVRGPRILAGGESLSPSGGHSDPSHGYREDLFELPGAALGICDGVAECRKAVRTQVKRGADVIKLTATGGVLSATNAGTAQQFFDDELEAIVQTAHALGRRVAAHAHGADGIKAALRAGVDSIEHGSFLDPEAVELFRSTGAYLVPTLLAGETVAEMAREEGYFPEPVRLKARQVAPVIIGAVGMAHKAGVNIAFGTDSGVSRHGENWREFELMERAGIEPAEALVMATRNAADLCGLEDVGTLEVGMRADVIAVDGNPLEHVGVLRSVPFVMKAGVIEKL